MYSDIDSQNLESIAPLGTQMPKPRNIPKQPQQAQAALTIKARSRQGNDFIGRLTPSQPNINQNGTVPAAVGTGLFPKVPTKLLPIYEGGNKPNIPHQPNFVKRPTFPSEQFLGNFQSRENVVSDNPDGNSESDEISDETEQTDGCHRPEQERFFTKRRKHVLIALTIIAVTVVLLATLLILFLKCDVQTPGK